MSALRDKFLARVYGGKSKDIDPEIINATSIELKNGMVKGYGSNFEDVTVDSNDFEMLSNLENSVYSFSAAKNYQELKVLTDLITDSSGAIRPFSEFRAEAEKVFKSFNEDWLSTEYGTAINGAMQASRWTDYTKNKKAMPYLRYVTAGDSRVRDSHKSLDGVVKRIDDNFWNSYYPPNGYNCRCTTTQTGQSKESSDGSINYPSVNPMFKVNLAKQGLIFPKDHPYYNGVPKEILRKALAYLPPENTYRTVNLGDGVTVQEHAMVQHEEERLVNRPIAKVLGEKHNVKLLPQISEKDTEARIAHYGKNYAGKHTASCPDAFVDDDIFEFKHVDKQRNMSKRVLQAANKADNCVIIINEKLEESRINSFASNQWAMDDRKNLKKLIVINNSKTFEFARP